MTLALVTVFGALGCVVRYLAEYAVRRHHPTLRPWATVGANALGCLVAAWAVYRLGALGDAHVRSVIVTGFCGGLTTFSSAFAVPAILQREHHWGYAAALVVVTPAACAAALLAGIALAGA
ncbi:MAG TPA: CrcB family protein [Acidimicrobiales bacterium]|nr:CrcB family protein [Acidimicrobiales bacterium]